jgi:hypothetical protein
MKEKRSVYNLRPVLSETERKFESPQDVIDFVRRFLESAVTAALNVVILMVREPLCMCVIIKTNYTSHIILCILVSCIIIAERSFHILYTMNYSNYTNSNSARKSCSILLRHQRNESMRALLSYHYYRLYCMYNIIIPRISRL